MNMKSGFGAFRRAEAGVGSHFEYSIETILGTLFVIDRAESQPKSGDSKTWITFADRGISVVPT